MLIGSEPKHICEAKGGQFKNPRGLAGRLVGRLMAVKNRYMNELAVAQLRPEPADRILEIGYGPGTAIALLSVRVTEGLVAGVDPSSTMFAQASRRNRRAIAAGRARLEVASASKLPFDADSFDKVFEVNSFHHWPEPQRALGEVRRILRPSGFLLLCLRMKHPTRKRLVAPGYVPAQVEEVVAQLRDAGFRDIEQERFALAREVTCIKGIA